MSKFDSLKAGRFVQHTTFTHEDGYVEKSERDVTRTVQELVGAYETAVKEREQIAKELSDLRTRKWWDEIELFTDRATGNVVAVRTHYQLEMKGMRLEMTPEQFKYMR